MFDHDKTLDTNRVVEIYESLRKTMPKAASPTPMNFPRLRDIIGNFEVLLLDGYGVINVGPEIVAGIDDLFAMAAAANIEVIVLTNGSMVSSSARSLRYREWGLDIHDERIVSSRDALLAAISDTSGRIGVIDAHCALPDGERFIALEASLPETWCGVDGICFMGSTGWDEHWQQALEGALAGGIPLHVANPDVVGPQGDRFSFEPGYWIASALSNLKAGSKPEIHWYGKPHHSIFDLALKRLQSLTGRDDWQHKSIAMVGDTLHTDILGGNAAGLSTVLVTGHGLFAQGGAILSMDKTGIRPDFIVETI